MFDLDSVLRAEPGNVRALCGRALLHLALDRQKVPRPLLGTPRAGGGVFWGAPPSQPARREGAGSGHPGWTSVAPTCPGAPRSLVLSHVLQTDVQTLGATGWGCSLKQ